MNDLMDNIELTLDDYDPDHPYMTAIMMANQNAATFIEQRKYIAARIALAKALSAAPNMPGLWINMSGVMWHLHLYEDAIMCAKRALKMDVPSNLKAKAYAALGSAEMALGLYNEADRHYIKAIEYDQRIYDARWNRSLLQLLMGKYEEGWKGYHLRTEETWDVNLKSKRWRGESLVGVSIRAIHDQGYGDTIMYCRFLQELVRRGAKKIYLSTTADMVPLLWDYQQIGIEFCHNGTPWPHTDYHTKIGQIPVVMNLSRNNIPPPDRWIKNMTDTNMALDIDKTFIDQPKVKPALKVGICWSGREDFARNDLRSIPLKLMASLAENPHIWLYSLQMGPQVKEIYELGLDMFIQDLSSQIKERGWLATATAIEQMDVVVTTCTSIAHLSATLEKPTFVLLCQEPYWIWGAWGERTPWYPSAKLFRQKKDGWAGVINEVRQVLMQKVAEQSGLQMEQV